MAKSFSINANIKTTFQGAEKGLESIRSSLLAMTQNVKGVGPATVKTFQEMASELDKLKQRASEGVLTGAFQDPAQTQAYLTDLRKQEEAHSKITQKILLGNIQNKDTIKFIQDQTTAINKKQEALEKNEKVLDDIRTKTRYVAEEEAKVGQKLGIDPKELRDPNKLQAEINKRKTASGQPIDTKARDELKYLDKLVQKRQQLEDEAGNILEKEQLIQDEIRQQNADIDQQKNARRQSMIEALNQLKVGKDITKEEKEKIAALIKQGATYEEIERSVKNLNYKQQAKEIQDTTRENKEFNKSLNKKKKGLFANITAATIYYAALRAVRQIIRQVVRTVTDLDKSFTEIAMVTKMNRKESWQLVGSYQTLAKEVGTTTDQIAKLGVYFARQGRSAAEAFELTRVAALAAKVASIDAADSADYLTSAINGFGLATTEAMAISDKFAALGASSASSYQEMAVALSKVAPSAKVAGVNIDQMLGFLAKGIETTREAPENIGTAFKTVFARMTQLRDFGKTLEEGVAVNTVEEALATAGVALRDNQGNFRQMGDVLTELGYKFEGLSRNQQAYIATALAGTRQQSRLLAVLQNFDRTMELVDVSMESAGATLAQHAEYAGGMEAANARLQTSFQQIITSLVESEVVIGIINIMAGALEGLSKVAGVLAFVVIGLATVFGIFKLVQAVSIVYLGVQAFLTGGLAKAKLALATATGIATAGTMAFGTALAISTGGLILIVGAVVGLIVWFSKMKSSTEKSTEKIKELQVELYNLNKETKDLSNLVNKFEELDKKVFKTAEDMKEMESVLSKIDEYGGNEYDFVFAGQLDMKAIDEFMKAKDKEKKEAQEEIRGEGRKNLVRMKRGKEQTTQTRQSIVEYLASTVEGFDAMDEAVQDRIRNAISQDVEGYAEAMTQSREVTTAGGTRVIISEYKSKIKPEVEELLADFNGMFTGELDSKESVELYNRYFELDPDERKMIEDAYANQLGDILELGDSVIRNFLSRGYNLSQISQLVQSIEGALSGINLFDYSMTDPNTGHASGTGPITTVTAGDVAAMYATGMSQVEPGDLAARNQVIDNTIDYLRSLGYESGNANLAVSNLINAITDPMAFQNAMNIFKSTADTVTSLIDASEAYQKGQIDDKLLSIIADYPELAEDIRNGTLDMADSIQIMVAKNAAEVEKKISDLQYQLQVETNEEMKQVLQAQIDTLEDMLTKESFLYGGIAEEVKVRNTEAVSDRFKAQIDFIKQYNSEQQKEIDLMEKKLSLNKSMLSLDRQIAALARDTSYGAQARSRDLQEQQRATAIEREKLVMDLVTEQAISELEKDRDKHIADIAANVAEIVQQMKDGTLGSDPFPASTGLITSGG
jgi:TP901 family phage tail tape measure protein